MTQGVGGVAPTYRDTSPLFVAGDSYGNPGNRPIPRRAGFCNRPRMPRYRRYFRNRQTVFLTIVSQDRHPWLASPGARDLVLDAWRSTRALHPYTHHGHVLLDDHLHLLLTPHPGVIVPKMMGSFKRTAMALLPPRTSEPSVRLWQRRYYDHVIRDADDFARHLDYIHFNPVKHGLARKASEWRWSSFHAWRRRGAYEIDWGSFEPRHIASMTK